VKKSIMIILAAVLLFSLFGCGQQPQTVITEDETSRAASSKADSSDDDGALVASDAVSSQNQGSLSSFGGSPVGASSSGGSSAGTSSVGADTNKNTSSAQSQEETDKNQQKVNGFYTLGNVGTATVIDDTERADALTLNKFHFLGAWSASDEAGFYGGSNAWIWQTNAYWELEFEGIQFEIYGQLYAHMGIYDVYIDGILTDEVDLFGPATWINGALNYRSPVLKPGKHVIKAVNTGRQNEKSLGSEKGRSCSTVDMVKVFSAP